jgi:hypothetical protein
MDSLYRNFAISLHAHASRDAFSVLDTRPTNRPEPNAAGHGDHIDECVDHQRGALRQEYLRQTMPPPLGRGAAERRYAEARHIAEHRPGEPSGTL